MIVRLGLMVLVTFGGAALTWLLLHIPQHAQAATLTQVATTKEPMGVVQDGTNVWVAEPGCDLDIASTCSSAFPGIIGRYSLANPSTHTDFTEPADFSSPGFLALDGYGNIWFTEPTTDAIGELTPTGGGTWNQWATGITAGSAPYNLAFDKNGNIWFTEGNRDAIGFFNTSTHQAVETTFKAGSDPDGMLADPTGTMWFAEDNSGTLDSFTPTTNGTITVNRAKVGQVNLQMLALDAQGNIWYSEGRHVAVGEYNPTTHAHTDFSLASVLCPTPPCPSGMYVGGIAVDGHGLVWFDEGTSGSVGFLDPVSKAITVQATVSSPSLGLIVDGANTVWVTEKFAHKLAEIVASLPPSPTPTGSTTPSPSPTATGTPPPTLQSGPVNKTWYFAEGRVGAGFTEYLSMDNPTPNACQVDIEYLYTPDRGTPLTKQVVVDIPANTRYEEGVDGDLGTSPNGPGITDSAIVTVDNVVTPNCAGIVAERPMYFNALGTNSGSDVLGVTHLGTTFYIADVATGAQAGGGSYSSFIPILNPPSGAGTATVTANYYSVGLLVGTDSTQVPVGTRGTIFPNSHTPALPAHVSVVVTSTQPVAVERPTYFSNINGGNAGTVSGGADVIAVQSLSNDWLFAEGYTGGQFQEQFVIANLDTTANAPAAVTIKLEPQNGGAVSTFNITVPTLSQTIWNVNTLSLLPGQSLSADISSTGARIVVEREMFFRYLHNANGRSLSSTGGTDVLGLVGPSAQSLYSFAEGYVNTGYDEWLTLQNPTTSTETIWITLYNALGHTYTASVSVPAQSRATEDITGWVIHNLYHSGDGFKGYEVSMTVQTTTTQGGPFLAERPMYWNAAATQGGSDIIGYFGG